MTNAYLVGSDRCLLIDPPAQSEALDEAVSTHSIDHVAVTHGHPDHIGAVSAYAAKTDATVWGRAGKTDRLAAAGIAVDRTYSDGTELPLEPPIRILDTPGHAPDHVTFVVGSASDRPQTAVTGDLAVADGSVFVGEPDGDMRTYMVSLRRLLIRDFDCLYPGHGDPIAAPSDRLRALLAHRKTREQRVIRAVQSGASTVDKIIDRAYDRDLGDLRDLAGQSVRAHLKKLARERRITWDGDRAGPGPTE